MATIGTSIRARIRLVGTTGGRAPQRLEALIAPAAGTVEFIARRILFIKILVVVLGGRELGGRRDFGEDFAFERPVLLQSRLGRLGRFLLCFIMIENGGSIFICPIAQILVFYRGIHGCAANPRQALVAAYR